MASYKINNSESTSSTFIIEDDNHFKMYSYKFDTIEMYNYIRMLENDYRIIKDFKITVSNPPEVNFRNLGFDNIINVIYENEKDNPYVCNVRGVGIIYSELEKILKSTLEFSDFHKKTYYLNVFLTHLDKFETYLKEEKENELPFESDATLNIEEKKELLNKYFNLYSFKKVREFDKDNIGDCFVYLGESGTETINFIKKTTKHIENLDKLGIKIKEKLR